ncbi:unnamed protein product [Alopecurus aequalis]
MAAARAVAAPSPAVTSVSRAAPPPRPSLRVSCRRSARSGVGGRARFSRNATNGAEAEPDSKGRTPQALLMVSLPVVAATIILLKQSSTED